MEKGNELKKERLVSIIIPVYNAENFIVDCISSAMNQSWPFKEIILVDDCSKDRSLAIAQGYACDWIKVYKLDTNKGQSFASNYGFKRSHGEFIKFLDADDILAPDYIENIFKKYDGEDCLYFSQFISFTGNFRQSRQTPYPIENWSSMEPVDFLLSSVSFMRQGGRWLIPRKIINKGGLWNESLSLINDFEYFTRLCLQCRQINYVPDAVLYYRQVEGSLSGQISLKAFQSAHQSIRLVYDQLLAVEDSLRTRKYIADTLQDLFYTIYPLYKTLTKEILNEIKLLGGSQRPAARAGSIFELVRKVFGWKAARQIQYLLQNLRIENGTR